MNGFGDRRLRRPSNGSLKVSAWILGYPMRGYVDLPFEEQRVKKLLVTNMWVLPKNRKKSNGRQ